LKALHRQLVDFIVYLALPSISVLLPAAWSRVLLARCSYFDWLLSMEAEDAWQSAAGFVDTGDEKKWKVRWKQVEMLDVRDLYLMNFGRIRSIQSEIECETALDIAKGRFLIGMHWGPSISILKLLQLAGLSPAIPFRQPEKKIARIRPFYYLFISMAARYIVKTMDVPDAAAGAGKVLRSMMGQAGTAIVVMDAPPTEGRSTLNATVLGKNAIFDAGFPAILVDKEKEYVLYSMSLQAGDSLCKKLELHGPYSASDAQEFLQNYADFLDRHLASDSAQWRIWHAAPQFWR
jgi:hypothetical protein